jgi:hypothetical protein
VELEAGAAEPEETKEDARKPEPVN